MSPSHASALDQAVIALQKSFTLQNGIPETLATPLRSWAEGLLYQQLGGNNATAVADDDVQSLVNRVVAALNEVQRLALDHNDLTRAELSERTAALFPARALRSPAFTVRIDDLVDNGGPLDAGAWLTSLLTLLQGSESFGTAIPKVATLADDVDWNNVESSANAGAATSVAANALDDKAAPSEPKWWLLGLGLLLLFMVLVWVMQ